MGDLSYRDILKGELTGRCAQNKRYSLRAFSRDLRMEPAQLSRVLNGKRNISSTKAQLIAQKIFKRTRDKNYFVSLVEYETAKTPQSKVFALEKLKRFKPAENTVTLQFETLKVIEDWYHFAILDLTSLDGFKLSAESAATRLGITSIEAKLAIERLLKLGLLERRCGRLVKSHKRIDTPSGIVSPSLRKWHKQMIAKALESVDAQNINRRYVLGKTMAIDRADLPKIRQIIDDYFDEISKIVHAAKRVDSLYQINVQLFDLIKKTEKKT